MLRELKKVYQWNHIAFIFKVEIVELLSSKSLTLSACYFKKKAHEIKIIQVEHYALSTKNIHCTKLCEGCRLLNKFSFYG